MDPSETPPSPRISEGDHPSGTDPSTPAIRTRPELDDRSQHMLMLVVRLIFMVMLISVSLLTVASKEDLSGRTDYSFDPPLVIGLILASTAIGLIVLVVDSRTPNKRLTAVVGVYLGVVAGLIGALAVGALLDVVARAWELTEGRMGIYLGLAKVMIAIILCYLAVSVVLTTKDDFRLVIPYVEFAKQVRGVRPLLIDTSALIDGRIDQFAQTGFLDAPLVLPQFVIEELQKLSDSGEKLKRERGRRGLDLVSTLQSNPMVDITIDVTTVPGHSVDHMLLHLAQEQNARILTTDYNLNKVGKIHGVTVLNVNDLAGTLRPQMLPGDSIEIEIVKRGEAATQGIGYLPDGTMVVVENAADSIGERVQAVVTNSLQTSAGRMIFARTDNGSDPARRVESLADAATHQPRTTTRPERRGDHSSARNPRR